MLSGGQILMSYENVPEPDVIAEIIVQYVVDSIILGTSISQDAFSYIRRHKRIIRLQNCVDAG